MTVRGIASRVLLITGLATMTVGVIDPVEGVFVILPRSGLAALGGFLGRRRRRWPIFWSFVLIAVGFGALLAMTRVGGVGGDSGRSGWWMLTALPYPIGWILGLVNIIPTLAEPAE
jgi:hypothetical protein